MLYSKVIPLFYHSFDGLIKGVAFRIFVDQMAIRLSSGLQMGLNELD